MPSLRDVQDTGTAEIKASSWLSYNGLLLTDVLTEEFSFEEVRTPDGSQVLYNHVVLKVTALIEQSLNNFRVSPGNPTPENGTIRGGDVPFSDDNAKILFDRLMKDRALLRYSMPGHEVLESPAVVPNSGGQRYPCDANQGPRPLYAQVTEIAGTSSFYVRFGIETWQDACTAGEKFIRAHRFSMAHDVDGDTWLTTRITTGQIYFRPEWLARKNTLAGQVSKSHWMHQVPPGFKRHNVKIQAAPNGMEVAYSFIDTEESLPLGSKSPALKLQAEFSLSSELMEGKPALTQASCHVSASGPKSEFRSNLLIMALRIGLRKIQKPGLAAITGITINYSLDKTFVDVVMRALWKPVGLGIEGMAIPDTGLQARQDILDLDDALIAYREAGEPAQASQRFDSLSPRMLQDNIGTYTGFLVASTIINGCFNSQPVPVVMWNGKTRNVNGTTLVPVGPDVDAEPINYSMVDNGGNTVPFSMQIKPELTLAMLPTGLSNAYVAAVGFYEEWIMHTRYHTNHQRAILPVGAGQSSSPGEAGNYRPPQIGTLGLPYTIKTVTWSIAWVGPSAAQIMLPSPDTGDANDVLIDEDISPAVPGFCNSSNKAWRVSGTYKYISKKLRTSSNAVKSQYTYVDDGFAVGKAITDPSARAENTIGQARFIAGYSPSFVG